MNKNVNLVLVFVIILVIGVIAASTVYFQDVFFRLTGNYSSTAGELKKTQDDLARYRQLYNDALLKLNSTQLITEQEKTDLRKVYIVKKGEAEQLNQTLTQTQTELSTTTQELFDTSNQLTEKTSLYNTALQNISSLQASVSSLRNQVSSLKTQVNSLKSQLEQCQAGG